MIEKNYNKSATNYRYDYNENNITERTEVDTFSCHLQHANPEETEKLGMRFTEAYEIWCDKDTDIEKGDEVVIDDWKYKVGGILKHEYGYNQHLKVFISDVGEYES
jgi:hypothetical protein